MKKLILVLALFLGFGSATVAQNKKLVEKTDKMSEYVAKEMKLDKKQQAFLNETLLVETDKMNKKAKGLSKEERKPLMKEYRKSLNKKLSKKFSKSEVEQINNHVKEYKKMNKKK